MIEFNFEKKKIVRCKHCNKQRGDHKAGTFNCPIGRTRDRTGSYGPFNQNQFWEQKVKKEK